jgi:hypothetical protein
MAQSCPNAVTVGSPLGSPNFVSFSNVRSNEKSIYNVQSEGAASLALSPAANHGLLDITVSVPSRILRALAERQTFCMPSSTTSSDGVA